MLEMDLSKLKNITNSYHDVRLISLRDWKQASEYEERDHGGPYVITQFGFDPSDPTMEPLDFLLGKSGRWMALSIFFGLPKDLRRDEFIFSTASEVMQLMTDLPARVKIISNGADLSGDAEVEHEEPDELNTVVGKAVTDEKIEI